VVSAITTGNTGLGIEAGLAVVILAIYLDRVTAAIGARSSVARVTQAE
jgi:glycine betaine/proline transport system permease protein